MSDRSPHVVIFVGPSIPIVEARAILDADYRAPVGRGDIAALLSEAPDIIGIIDGRFLQNFAISPKEILIALERGVLVYGSSSMGALRATELHPFGMIGVGQVFELFRNGELDADDEVAMVYADEDLRPLSEPMVNIRIALERATAACALSSESAQVLLETAKSLWFPRRTYANVVKLAEGRVSTQELDAFRAFVREHRPDAKREDAVLLLKRARDHVVERVAEGAM